MHHYPFVRCASTTPPNGLRFPPNPKTVTFWTSNGDLTVNSYTFNKYKLLGPFLKTNVTTTKDAKSCFYACAAYESPLPPSKSTVFDLCRSWTWNSASKKCLFSGFQGCTVYTPQPMKECVRWQDDVQSTSGWTAVPLQ